jgi:hypothetical protein
MAERYSADTAYDLQRLQGRYSASMKMLAVDGSAAGVQAAEGSARAAPGGCGAGGSMGDQGSAGSETGVLV